MRKIKFRGMSVDTGKWLYGVPLFSGRDAFIITVDNRGCDLDSSVIKDSVGQYTGLKDKNGVEIYEGDEYHLGDPNITYTVVWHDSGLIGKQNGSSSYAGLSSWQERIEVIGNIHENGDLLESP